MQRNHGRQPEPKNFYADGTRGSAPSTHRPGTRSQAQLHPCAGQGSGVRPGARSQGSRCTDSTPHTSPEPYRAEGQASSGGAPRGRGELGRTLMSLVDYGQVLVQPRVPVRRLSRPLSVRSSLGSPASPEARVPSAACGKVGRWAQRGMGLQAGGCRSATAVPPHPGFWGRKAESSSWCLSRGFTGGCGADGLGVTCPPA